MKLIILKIIIKILKPRHRVLIQKIDQEYIVLITPNQNQEGLISLISDKDTLANYVSLREIHSKLLTHECKLKFKPKT
jgi:hypothetical protein